MEYNFCDIEKKWQKYWVENNTYKTSADSAKPKFYILDMFPYPSGSGLHVGHPLGYIASDIYARFMRAKGYNVLHPMGYDSFGLPAEQYAIQTGRHPAITTEQNIKRYREQLDNMGFSFDWERQVKTSDPSYYKWTQWIFIQLFNSWYNIDSDRAEDIKTLVETFEKEGNQNVNAVADDESVFSSSDWQSWSEVEKQHKLMNYRLAYLSDKWVNWCPELGTVLADSEVKDGLSERGGFVVEKKLMKQWLLRISAYSQRLLDGLEAVEWSDSMKEMQRNWIGRSEGAMVNFKIKGFDETLEVFTTRPDTIFGVTFMVLAPEHELVSKITAGTYKDSVEKYIKETQSRSERERMAEVKRVTGTFTGAFAEHPFTKENIPVWIGDYVLAGYGTGAVMAVPSGDERDYAFAKHFNLPVKQIVAGKNIDDGAYSEKTGKMINSGFLNDMDILDAVSKSVEEIESRGIGKGKINFRMRDAIYSRQRYWGEPFPVCYKDDLPYMLDEEKLPLCLPEVDKFVPTEAGEPPLGRAKDWKTKEGYRYEFNTMPGWAGSSWYFLRYMDPENENEFVSKEAENYWQNVDLYMGGAEHATGHLLYARFWQKFLKDKGLVTKDEPFKKMINQGMILGISSLVYRVKGTNRFVSKGLKANYETTPIHVDVDLVNEDILDCEAFIAWRPEFNDAEFELENGKYICGSEVEKMSKSFLNVINPDLIVEKYGADTLRLYEMFLGPLEQAKPWDTKGIEGVHRFLKKLWRLFFNHTGQLVVSEAAPDKKSLKVLHQCIKKVTDDTERFSFNTAISAFMIGVNELTGLNCNNKEILSDFVILLAPYAPHLSEELWQLLGNDQSVTKVDFPVYKEEYLIEDAFEYPISFNGKTRFKLEVAVSLGKEEVEKSVMEAEQTKKWLDGKTPKKVIVVTKRIVNIVV